MAVARAAWSVVRWVVVMVVTVATVLVAAEVTRRRRRRRCEATELGQVAGTTRAREDPTRVVPANGTSLPGLANSTRVLVVFQDAVDRREADTEHPGDLRLLCAQLVVLNDAPCAPLVDHVALRWQRH